MSFSVADPVRPIRVGLTEAHGVADEQRRVPPDGVTYSFLTPDPKPPVWWIRSPIKGYLRRFDSDAHDLLEAVLTPIVTRNRWVFSVENLQAPAAFSFLGAPLPRMLRLAYLSRLFRQPNLRKLVVWSQAGLDSFRTYGQISDERITQKLTVVYPAVQRRPDDVVTFRGEVTRLLFSGDFFRKGGVNVLDAFERLQPRYPSIHLTICSDERIDFNTSDAGLRATTLERIRRNPGITFGRVKRDDMLARLLPETDIFLLPTYAETFGFAALEAMSFGIPVIASTSFALPEIVEDGVSGKLIDIGPFDCDRLFRGYVVNHLPADFREFVTESLYRHLCDLIESVDVRRSIAQAALHRARTVFSIEQRNERMRAIYLEALED